MMVEIPEIGQFTRKAAAIYKRCIKQSEENTTETEKYTQAFSEIDIYLNSTQVQQIFDASSENGKTHNRPATINDTCRSHQSLSFSEFVVFSVEIITGNISFKKDISHNQRYNSIVSKELSKGDCFHEVFLGGSCNPTTWRRQVAIPLLQNEGITYYNPQVEKWSPDLIDIEEHAKENAVVLLFVIDNQTRAVSSLLETAFLIGNGQKVVVVMNEMLSDNAQIAGELINEREIADLNEGRKYVKDLIASHDILMETSVHNGLILTSKLIKSELTRKELTENLKLNRDYFKSSKNILRKLEQIFTMYDNENKNKLSEKEAIIALKCLNIISGPLPTSLATLVPKIRHEWCTDGISFDSFCLLYSEIKYSQAMNKLHNGSSWWTSVWSFLWLPFEWMSGLWSVTLNPTAGPYQFDVFLGGCCDSFLKWRCDISIPLLRQHGIFYFNPQLHCKTTTVLEERAKNESKVLLFVIPSELPAVTYLIEAAYYLGLKRNIVLCIQQLNTDKLHDINITAKGVKDYIRARSYLTTLANKHRVPVFTDVSEATLCCICKVKQHHSNHVLNFS